MMTTIEISDTLMLTAQQLAHQRNLTLRQVVESALQTFVEQEQHRKQGFRLRKCTYRGNGLHPDIQEGDWATICQRVYEMPDAPGRADLLHGTECPHRSLTG